MRLATYSERGRAETHLGLVLGERIVALEAAASSAGLPPLPDSMLEFIAAGAAAMKTASTIAEQLSRKSDAGVPIGDVRLRAPIPRPARNLVCVGLNYADHVAE